MRKFVEFIAYETTNPYQGYDDLDYCLVKRVLVDLDDINAIQTIATKYKKNVYSLISLKSKTAGAFIVTEETGKLLQKTIEEHYGDNIVHIIPTEDLERLNAYNTKPEEDK
ncbi:MAG: hypothetical protein IKP66_09740 [Lachnospiraceae bacterium]|jgi:hypothetical protein|nr:hypothetical protein [Lachnospiraceae bacterium]